MFRGFNPDYENSPVSVDDILANKDTIHHLENEATIKCISDKVADLDKLIGTEVIFNEDRQDFIVRVAFKD